MTELRGINSRAELAEAEATVQGWLRARRDGGRRHADRAGDRVPQRGHASSAPDVTVGPNVVFGPGVSVADGAEIRAFSHLEGCRVGQAR